MSSAGQLVTGVKHGKAIDVSGGVLRKKNYPFFVYCIVVKIVFFKGIFEVVYTRL